MPNFQQTLKNEIARIARKEVRSQTDALKHSSATARAEIAALKRRVGELERALQRAQKAARRAPHNADAAAESSNVRHRFSAKRLAKHRERLQLSAVELGLLLGASDQSVRQWERGDVRPRDAFLPAIASLRQLTPRSASALLKERLTATGSSAE